jgi:LPXTG-motif cell wall-anchored protein
VYRSLVAKDTPPSTGRRVLKGGVLGLTALGLAGWFLRKKPDETSGE